MKPTTSDWVNHFAALAEQGIDAGSVNLYYASKPEPAAVNKTIPLAKRIANSWGNLETVQKVDAGMWGAGALLSAFGVISAAKSSVSRDEEGKAHVQWSQVGVLLLQATFAAGCAYMTHRTLNGAVSR